MFEPRRAVLLDILDLERRLLDVHMKFLAEHGSMRAAGGREDRNNHRPDGAQGMVHIDIDAD